MNKIEELVKNESFIKELLSMESNEAVIALFKNNGVDITNEEVEELAKGLDQMLNSEANLSEEELQNISGGVIGTSFVVGWALKAAAVLIAGKAIQEGTDYVSCEATGKPFWKHKNQNYCDKYK